MDASNLNVILYAGSALTTSEWNLSRELRGERLGVSFDFVYEVPAHVKQEDISGRGRGMLG